MTGGTADIIIEQLRLIQSDIASVKDDVNALRERTDTLESQLTGLSYLLTTGLGSVR
ncbi:MAG TPA: hypothetical protein VF601_19885 [Beijerinckiaceae bacterium]